MALKVLSAARVQTAVQRHGKREFSLFLGAGASISSGVPSAGAMIRMWRRQAYEEDHPGAAAATDDEVTAWAAKQKWGRDAAGEYSDLFEFLYHNEALRQSFIAEQVEKAFPSWGYLYLASIMMAGHFDIAYTTNFDDLIHDALTVFASHNPVVSAADSQIDQVNPTSDRVKIVKLHGDYLFKRLKNTRRDLQELDPVMDRKFREFSRHRGVIVLGYSGRDLSIMRVFRELLALGDECFPTGVYWGLREPEDPGPVAELAEKYPDRFYLFHCPDFDEFMADLHTKLGLELPETIQAPYRSLRTKLVALLRTTGAEGRANPTIARHREQLQRKLAELPLLEAQVLLANRRHEPALEILEQCARERRNDPLVLSVWGGAYVVAAEETGDMRLLDRAAEKWKRAVKADPRSVAPRRGLVSYCMMRNLASEAVQHAEAIVREAPHDTMARVTLGQLYLRVNRPHEALEQANWLVQKYPDDPPFSAFRADLLAATGHLAEAAVQGARAVELDPKNAGFRAGLGSIYAMQQRFPEAERELLAALQLEKDNVTALGKLTILYGMSGRVAEHQQMLARLQVVAPSVAQSLVQMAGPQPPPAAPPAFRPAGPRPPQGWPRPNPPWANWLRDLLK